MTPFLSVVSHSLAPIASAFALSTLLVGAAHAQPTSLVQGQGVTITAADMQADSQRMPPEMRNLVLSDVRKTGQIAENLYIRRVLANQAVEKGLDKDPAIAAAAAIARDKVLSDALILKIDEKNMPSDAALEAMARNVHKANPDRFKSKEQVHVRHILLSKDGDKARADAEAMLKQLKAGADFAVLAKQHSKDTGSAAKGGDLVRSSMAEWCLNSTLQPLH